MDDDNHNDQEQLPAASTTHHSTVTTSPPVRTTLVTKTKTRVVSTTQSTIITMTNNRNQHSNNNNKVTNINNEISLKEGNHLDETTENNTNEGNNTGNKISAADSVVTDHNAVSDNAKNVNGVTTSNEVDNSSESNMNEDNVASNGVDYTSENNSNDDNDSSKERANLELPFANTYAPKINNIAPEFHNGIVMKKGKEVASSNNMNNEDYGPLRTYAPKLTKIHTDFQKGVAMKQAEKDASANNTDNPLPAAIKKRQTIASIKHRSEARKGENVYEVVESDDERIDVLQFMSDEENDTDDEMEHKIVQYPPRSPFTTWNGSLHLKFGKRVYRDDKVVAVTKVASGSYVHESRDVEVGEILIKIDDVSIHGYTYKEVMKKIYDRLKKVVYSFKNDGDPGNENENYLQLTFVNRKVYRLGGTRMRPPDGFYKNDGAGEEDRFEEDIEVSDNNNNDDGTVEATIVESTTTTGDAKGPEDKFSAKGPDQVEEYFSDACKDSDYDAAKDEDNPFADADINYVGPDELYRSNLVDDGYAVVNTSMLNKFAFAWELVQYYLTEKKNPGSVDQHRSKWAVCFNDKKITEEDEKNGIITNRWIHGHTEENSFFTEGLLELVCVILSMVFGTSITFF